MSVDLKDVKDQINYTREAFFSQYNIVSLVGLGLFGMVAGAASIPAITIGAGLELLYLLSIPELKRFRRAVEARKNYERRMAIQAQLLESIKTLHPNERKKYAELMEVVKTIERNYQNLGSISENIIENSRQKFTLLTDTYLRLLILREQQAIYLRISDQERIRQDLTKLEKDIKEAPPKLQEILNRRIEILKKRLEKFEKSKEHGQVINAQLLTIEDMLKLLRDQSFTLKDPSQISDQLDTIMLDVESTEQTVKEMEELFAAADQYMVSAQSAFESQAQR